MRDLIRFCAPYGLVELHRQRAYKAQRAAYHSDRHQRTAKALSSQAKTQASAPDFDVEAAIQYLLARGLDEHQIREGSISAWNLDFMASLIAAQGWEGRKLLGLHVGNFVGVSLAWFIRTLTGLHPSSLVIAIDPNLPHRGITSPQDHVLALLSNFNLQSHAIVIAGYSLEKSISNEGTLIGGYDPSEHFKQEFACENVIANLASIFGSFIDVALMDGNHEASYLRREVSELTPALRAGGLLIFDDISRGYEELREVYFSLPSSKWQSLGTDGQVGVLRKVT
jgi:hypothetical protein